MSTGLPADLRAAVTVLARVPRLLVALDFDGTLAPHVDDPDAARPLPESQAAIDRLVSLPRTRVALISGRAIDSLERVASPAPEILLVGSHGLEQRFDEPYGGLQLTDDERALRAGLEAVLLRVAERYEGVWLEEKPAGFVIHTRLVSDELATQVQEQARVDTASLSGLGVKSGHAVLEFAVRVATKGDGIRRLRDYVTPDAILFAGDDVTDEDAIAELEPRDLGIKVGPGHTRAGFRIGGPAEVALVLAELASLRAGA